MGVWNGCSKNSIVGDRIDTTGPPFGGYFYEVFDERKEAVFLGISALVVVVLSKFTLQFRVTKVYISFCKMSDDSFLNPDATHINVPYSAMQLVVIPPVMKKTVSTNSGGMKSIRVLLGDYVILIALGGWCSYLKYL